MHSSPAPVDLAGRALVACAVIVVAAGAIYFGLFSCGGLAWHKSAFLAVAPIACVVAVAWPSRVLSSMRRKAIFLLLVGLGYVLLKAAAAPFYPRTPASLGEYGRLFLQALEFGSCG